MAKPIATLNDNELLNQLHEACASSRRCTARVIALLMHVEDRRLHLAEAIPSLFEYCVRRLLMSEGEAYRRITAARLAAQFPSVLGRIENGDLNLSNLMLLRDYLTEENAEELLDDVKGKSKMAVLEMLAARMPRPDAPSRLRKLPQSKTGASVAPLPDRFEPISESRYRLQATISLAGRNDLERARELVRHRNISAEPGFIIERSLAMFVAYLEKEIFGKTTREIEPKPDVAKTTGDIPRAVRREVFERDGYQCTFVSKRGERCTARGHLELDHIKPRAKGGTHDAANLRVRCRPHNLAHAEEVFGRDVVRDAIATRQRKSRRAKQGGKEARAS